MITGIYLLTFSEGHFYIGQSVDIENRWKQHFDKFRKGTAAKPMQAAFNAYGFPSAKVLVECHRDHLDMLEAMFITFNKSPKMLNTSIPRDYSMEEISIATKDADHMKMSTVELLTRYRTGLSNIKALEQEVESLRDEGLVLPSEIEEISEENERLNLQLSKLITVNQELSKRANMSWWDRLWS